jgi:hypothetical protein
MRDVSLDSKDTTEQGVNTLNRYVWYASYGSNTLPGRFYYYIEGGLFPCNSILYEGCRDKSLPLDEKPITIPHSLYFAKHRDLGITAELDL